MLKMLKVPIPPIPPRTSTFMQLVSALMVAGSFTSVRSAKMKRRAATEKATQEADAKGLALCIKAKTCATELAGLPVTATVEH